MEKNKEDKKKILTIKTINGNIYQKIKLTSKHKTYEHILHEIKNPEGLHKDVHTENFKIEKEIKVKLFHDTELIDLQEPIICDKHVTITFQVGYVYSTLKIPDPKKWGGGEFTPKSFPPYVTSIEIYNSENPLPPLPKGLKSFSFYLLRYLPKLPDGLEGLYLGGYYADSLPKKLPSSLKYLSLNVGYMNTDNMNVPEETDKLKINYFTVSM